MNTLLIIDDESDILDIIAGYVEFSNLNLNVLKAQTVLEAKKLIPVSDIIISDINMPNRDELEFLLKNCGKPLARITGYLEIEGEFVIAKPFSSKDLIAVIEKLVERINSL